MSGPLHALPIMPRMLSLRCLCVLALLSAIAIPVPASERVAVLRSPLTTVLPLAETLRHDTGMVAVRITVPDDAPADLGMGLYLAGKDGRWHQIALPQQVPPGNHRVLLPIGANAPVVGEPTPLEWDTNARATVATMGLFFWSSSTSDSHIVIREVEQQSTSATTIPYQLRDLELPGFDAAAGVCRLQTGQRWQLDGTPDPVPANPFDPQQLEAWLVLTDATGATTRVPAFWREPHRLTDRGDHERAEDAGPGRLSARFRPREPGRYRARLDIAWGSDTTRSFALPDLVVSGEAWNPYVRISKQDPRYFAIADDTASFYWPLSVNLRSITDDRAYRRLNTQPTPTRGLYSYRAYLDRFAAAGIEHIEVWMSSWNLALEWNASVPGFQGLGRYNQENAARLDALLDSAWERGMRVTLVLHNHGMASTRADREWRYNPYSRSQGGPLQQAEEFFHAEEAISGQHRLRRYVAARYADHPAVFSWKLFSETDLTDQGWKTRNNWYQSPRQRRDPVLERWFAQAAEDWHDLDIYDHPVVAHWSDHFRMINPGVAALDELDALACNAYHNRRGKRPGTIAAERLWETLHEPKNGLWRGFRGPKVDDKPVFITEYGGAAFGAPHGQLVAEQHHGPWAALVSGIAAGPMLWWFEWIDQHEVWGNGPALKAFLAEEDLRGGRGSIALGCNLPTNRIWQRAWWRPGRLLGYVLDYRWAWDGSSQPPISDCVLTVGDNVGAGTIMLEWWDCDTGDQLQVDTIDHPGGKLDLTVPPFVDHIAYKMYRVEE